MADSLKVMGEMLPVDEWRVYLNKDGNAEVCVTQLDGFRYWYTVKDVQIEHMTTLENGSSSDAR